MIREIDSLSIADAIQHNLKNLARLKNDIHCRTVYEVICGQVDTLVKQLEEECDDECGCESPGVEKESDAMFDACKYGKAAFSQMAAKMNNELKPCPFCGNVPDVVTSWIPRKVYSTMCVYPNCTTRPGTDYFSKRCLAVNAWNNRNKGEIKA